MTSYEIGNPVIKSPLDTHGYRMIQLKDNGLKCLLVSTCIHPRDPEIDKMATSRRVRTNCTFSKIAEFNEKYSGISENDKPEPSTKSDGGKTFKLSKPSKRQLRETASKRNLAAKASRGTKPQVKCRRGQHEQDDEMQSFCNTKCVGVLYVKAGFHQDPHDIPGMAHFCEHAMSLGSKNYPETEAFSKFVDAQEGFYNARTEQEDTIYYFYIKHEQIETAMDMFVDMFVNPVFKQRDLQKEINNINSEFLMKRMLDELRQIALIQSCLPQKHPANGFGMGSKATLSRADIMDQLRHWIKQYYCGENMFFALQGPLSLDELERLAVTYGANFPGRNAASIITRPLTPSSPFAASALSPFEKGKWNQVYYMDSSGSTSTMTVAWALPPKFGKNYATKPVQYYSYILNHKGEGSLDWYLKQRGWITALVVNSPDSPFYCTEQYTLFCVSADLTADGLENRIKVLATVFAYMKLLQEKKASREIYAEIQQLQADIFHYRSDTNLSDPTLGRKFGDRNVNETLWTLLHVLSKTEVAEEVLLSTFLVRNFDAAVLDEFCNRLHPGAAMVIFADKSFAEKGTLQEKWYGTKYFTQAMPHAWKTPEWAKHVPKIPTLRFPERNKFISISFCYADFDEGSTTMRLEKRDDFVVYDSLKGYITYGNSKCQKGLLPSAQYILEFFSPALESDTDLVNTPALDLFLRLLEFILDVELGTALSSLISYELDSGMGHVRAILSGPSPKLPELAKKILKVIERFDEHANLYPQTFEDLKRVQVGIYNSIMKEQESCSSELLQYLLSLRNHFLSDYVVILEESMDPVDFFSFVHDFKRRLYINGDLNGCVSVGHATKVAKMVDELKSKPYLKKLEHEPVDRCIELPAGERCLLAKAKSREDGNVVVRNYYQVGVLRDAVQLRILSAITAYLAEASFEELRTVQSLGYIAEATRHEMAGVYGVVVFVQGAAEKHSSGFINERIDAFMELAFKKCLDTESAFRQNIIPFLDEGEELKYQATRRFYQDHFLPEGSKFRKVSIQMEGYYRKSQNNTPLMPTQVEKKVAKYTSGEKLIRCPGAGANCGISRYSTYLELNLKDVTEKNGYFITDVSDFKNGRPCFPNSRNEDDDDD